MLRHENLRMTRRDQYALYGASAALVVLAAIIWLAPGPSVVQLPPARITAGSGHAAALDRDAPAWADAVLARPLFTQGRHPPAVPHGPLRSTGGSLPRLSGVMITATGKRAIFTPEGGGKPLTLAEGAALDDQIIKRIEPGRVILHGPKGDTELRTSLDKNHVAGTSPLPAAPVFPGAPQFSNPMFPNGFGAPGFRPQGLPGAIFTPPTPQLQPQPAAPAPDDTSDSDANQQPGAVPAVAPAERSD